MQYIMRSPSGDHLLDPKHSISPFSTLVYFKVEQEQGVNIDEAVTDIAMQLGITRY